MFNGAQKPPTLDEIIRGLQVALPGGEAISTSIVAAWPNEEERFLTKEFVFHQHRFLFKGDDVKGVPVYTVYWAPRPIRPIGPEHPTAFLDTCEVSSEEDLIGWTSYVRGEVERLALMPFVRELQPSALFPDGWASIKEHLQVPKETLIGCGILDLVPLLKVHFQLQWQKSIEEGKVRFYLPLSGGGREGYCAAKFTAKDMHEGMFRYKFEFPVPLNLRQIRRDPTDETARGKWVQTESTSVRLPHDLIKGHENLLAGFLEDQLTDDYLQALLRYVNEQLAA